MAQTRDAMIPQRFIMRTAHVMLLALALTSCGKQPANPTCEPGSPADTAAPDTATLDVTTGTDAADSSIEDTNRPAAALELPLGTSTFPLSSELAYYLSWVALETTDTSIYPRFLAYVGAAPSAASTKLPIYLPTGWEQIPMLPWLCPDGNSGRGSLGSPCLAETVSTAYWVAASIGDKRFRCVNTSDHKEQYVIERTNIDGSGAVAAKVVGEKSDDPYLWIHPWYLVAVAPVSESEVYVLADAGAGLAHFHWKVGEPTATWKVNTSTSLHESPQVGRVRAGKVPIAWPGDACNDVAYGNAHVPPRPYAWQLGTSDPASLQHDVAPVPGLRTATRRCGVAARPSNGDVHLAAVGILASNCDEIASPADRGKRPVGVALYRRASGKTPELLSFSPFTPFWSFGNLMTPVDEGRDFVAHDAGPEGHIVVVGVVRYAMNATEHHRGRGSSLEAFDLSWDGHVRRRFPIPALSQRHDMLRLFNVAIAGKRLAWIWEAHEAPSSAQPHQMHLLTVTDQWGYDSAIGAGLCANLTPAACANSDPCRLISCLPATGCASFANPDVPCLAGGKTCGFEWSGKATPGEAPLPVCATVVGQK